VAGAWRGVRCSQVAEYIDLRLGRYPERVNDLPPSEYAFCFNSQYTSAFMNQDFPRCKPHRRTSESDRPP